MKLIHQYIDLGEASDAKSRLSEAGIMAEVSLVDPHIIQPSKSGAQRIGLWVVNDNQFKDALRLLENTAPVPQQYTSLEEMHQADLHTNTNLFIAMKNILKKLLS